MTTCIGRSRYRYRDPGRVIRGVSPHLAGTAGVVSPPSPFLGEPGFGLPPNTSHDSNKCC